MLNHKSNDKIYEVVVSKEKEKPLTRRLNKLNFL